ncbi:MAG: O-antigen ligase family protein [Burkholderiales bacterium]|nr:O-antigen ligase family protein [Burkholderiales bacterium]
MSLGSAGKQGPWWAGASPLLAWALYLPLGARYALALGAAGLATLQLRRAGRLRAAFDNPAACAWLALLAWLALTALWSPADPARIASHLWTYALPLLLPLLAAAMDPAWAQRALQQFGIASALVGGLFLLHRLGLPAESAAWESTVAASGNQRIANSILLALGSVLALWQCAQARGRRRVRAAWMLAAALAALGLALQDRRSGMLLLPLLLLVWILRSQRSRLERLLLLGALALACTLAWIASDGVRQRFDEGWRELQADTSTDAVATSWGQRVRMNVLTARMVSERPWFGHGVGSWIQTWQQRVTPGTELHEHTTPHNEYLLVAQQGGAVALVLLLAAGVVTWRRALAGGAAGIPLLLACTAIAATGLFNAVLRDAKFSLPLLLLAAAAAAAARQPSPPD